MAGGFLGCQTFSRTSRLGYLVGVDLWLFSLLLSFVVVVRTSVISEKRHYCDQCDRNCH